VLEHQKKLVDPLPAVHWTSPVRSRSDWWRCLRHDEKKLTEAIEEHNQQQKQKNGPRYERLKVIDDL
jgi:hypothetical protein